MQPMYTKEEWKKVAPLFASKRLAISTVEVAKAVLVDGQRITDVAEARGMTKQTAHAAVKRVRKILEEQGAVGKRGVCWERAHGHTSHGAEVTDGP